MDIKRSKKEYLKQIWVLLLKVLHLLVSIVLFFVFLLILREGKIAFPTEKSFRFNCYITIGYIVLISFFNRIYNAYLLGYNRIRELAAGQALSQFFSLLAIYFGISLVWNQLYNPVPFIILYALQLLFDVIWSWFGNKCYFSLYPPRRTLLVYRNELDKTRFGNIHGKPVGRLYKITSELQYDGKYEDLKDKLKGYEAIFVTGVNSRCRNGILKYCKENDIPGFFLPHIGDVIVKEAKHIQSFDTPVLTVNRTHLKPEYLALKRLSDLLLSLIGIVIASPLMGITAIAIKIYDHGPVIYKQVRLTKDGKEFKLYKFRSMRVDAEKDGVARLSSGDRDDRITPIGRLIRKCRVDELPQLFNILKGDMSLVGPRPERPEIAEKYYHTIPEFDLRLQVKAGLTGYAQVYGKYNTDPYEKLEFDLLYINNMSFFTDIRLLFATIGILFLPESTAGIAEGATTAMNYGYESITDNTKTENQFQDNDKE